MKRLFAIDLDGTLLTNNKKLPSGAKSCFLDIQDTGDVVLFMTGRTYEQTGKYIRALGVDGMVICNDGRYILKTDGTIVDKCADLNYLDVQVIIKSLKALKRMYYVLAFRKETEYIVSFNLMSLAVFVYKRLIRKKKIEFTWGFKQSNSLQDLDKLIIGCKNRNHIFERLNSTLGKRYNIFNLQDENKIQISGLEANKLYALKKVQMMLDISDECVYVFGNDGNDERVLEYYQNSFAVSNACRHIRNVAKEVIGSNENGAVIIKLNELRG